MLLNSWNYLKNNQGHSAEEFILLTSNDKNCKIVSLGRSTCWYTKMHVTVREPSAAPTDMWLWCHFGWNSMKRVGRVWDATVLQSSLNEPCSDKISALMHYTPNVDTVTCLASQRPETFRKMMVFIFTFPLHLSEEESRRNPQTQNLQFSPQYLTDLD